MKKTFQLTHPKIKTPRLFERVKHDIRKYVKRERRKELPKGVDFWDFDCKFGAVEAEATSVHLEELTNRVDDAEQRGLTSFYVEILAKPGHRTKKPKPDPNPSPDPESIGKSLFEPTVDEPADTTKPAE